MGVESPLGITHYFLLLRFLGGSLYNWWLRQLLSGLEKAQTSILLSYKYVLIYSLIYKTTYVTPLHTVNLHLTRDLSSTW